MFLNWLGAQPRDLTTGTLYPYLKGKAVYLCPTDKAALAANCGPLAPPPAPAIGCLRDYSYAMNCIICHDADSAKFKTPAQTLLFMEADLQKQDYSGMVGPVSFWGNTNAMSPRHTRSGHMMFCDFHTQRVKDRAAQTLERSRRFWLPCPATDPITIQFTQGLPDP